MSSFLHRGLAYTPGLFSAGVVDPDVTNFFSAATANGGTYNAADVALVTNAVSSLKAEGLWNKMKFVWLPVGGNLSSAMAVLKHDVATGTFMSNTGYVEGDWDRTVGLDGRSLAVNKFIDTNLRPSQMSSIANNSHIAIYLPIAAPAATGTRDVSHSTSNGFELIVDFQASTTSVFYRVGGGNNTGVENITGSEAPVPAARGLYVGTTNGNAADANVYYNSQAISTGTGSRHSVGAVSNPSSGGNVFINNGFNNSFGRKCLSLVTAGQYLTPVEVSRLTNISASLQTQRES